MGGSEPAVQHRCRRPSTCLCGKRARSSASATPALSMLSRLPLMLSVQLGFPPVQVDFRSQFRGSFRLRLSEMFRCQQNAAPDPAAGLSTIDAICRNAFGTANENTLDDAMSDPPRSYLHRAMRVPPRRRRRRRSHSSALLDNGSPNNASKRPARPIFEPNLW